MSHHKKKHPHYCHIHPKSISIGRCASCRSWICKECANAVAGQLYCINKCGAQGSIPIPQTAGEKPKETRRVLIPPGMMILAALTLGLCGVVFGLWEKRQCSAIRIEIEAYKNKRIELIHQIQNGNKEICLLTNELDSIKRQFPSDAGKKGKITIPLQNSTIAPIEGLPVSFDNGSTKNKVVALTFDGNGLNNAVGDILDTLKSRDVKTTVFLTGDFLRAFPAMVKRIVAEGHEAGNHTFSHPHLTSWAQDRTHTTLPSITEFFLCRELARTDSIFFTITGNHFPPLWRAPFGEKNRTICSWAQHCGYIHIGWRQGKTWRSGLDSNDWIADEETPGFHSPEEVLEKIIALAQNQPEGINGGIILMHLGTVRKDSKSQVHRILGRLIDDLKNFGYDFITISEMLKKSGVDLELLGTKKLTGNCNTEH
jgi:peptidoglycan/xylan/chitin deacetylase (PgdA/CDA1 family)